MDYTLVHHHIEVTNALHSESSVVGEKGTRGFRGLPIRFLSVEFRKETIRRELRV